MGKSPTVYHISSKYSELLGRLDELHVEHLGHVVSGGIMLTIIIIVVDLKILSDILGIVVIILTAAL